MKTVIKIKGMHCTSCAFLIDGELEELEGVKNASTSYAKGQVEVEFDENTVTQDKIIQAIQKLGYEPSISL